METIFDKPNKSELYNPRIITFSLWKNATWNIILDTDWIDAIVEDRLRERIEDLARLEHQQWIDWSKNIAEFENISKERLERWEKLWVDYDLLTEEQKDQDRVYCAKIFSLFN